MNNFALLDVVGYTGVYEVAVITCTETDNAIGKAYEQCKETGPMLLMPSITAMQVFSTSGHT